jgi:hypothetical protein
MALIACRLVCVGLLCAAWTLAPPAFGDAAGDLERGIKAFDEGDMEKAEPLLRSAVDGLRDPKKRAVGFLYLGLSQASRQAVDTARKSFADAIRADPRIKPDPDRVPPGILKIFESVRGAMTGELRIEAREPNARVSVDGSMRGLAPLTLRLPIGKHRVRVISVDELRQFEEPEVMVSLEKMVTVSARLAARMAQLKVSAVPGGVSVLANGQLVGSAPGVLSLPAGRHSLTFRAEGYVELTRDISLEPDKTASLEIRLTLIPQSWYTRRRPWGWVSVGISAGALVTGLVLGKMAQSSESDLRSSERAGTLDYDRLRSLQDSATSNARTANILFGLAGAAAVTGLVLVVVGDGKDNPSATSWRVLPLPGGVSIARGF